MVRTDGEPIFRPPKLDEEQSDKVASELAEKINALPEEQRIFHFYGEKSPQMIELANEAYRQGLTGGRILNTIGSAISPDESEE